MWGGGGGAALNIMMVMMMKEVMIIILIKMDGDDYDDCNNSYENEISVMKMVKKMIMIFFWGEGVL